jgi:hypothetical protein
MIGLYRKRRKHTHVCPYDRNDTMKMIRHYHIFIQFRIASNLTLSIFPDIIVVRDGKDKIVPTKTYHYEFSSLFVRSD